MSDLFITVKAPPSIGALQKADCDYLIDRISHTRFIASSSHGISVDESRLYEAAKTVLHAMQVLGDAMDFSEVDLQIMTEKRTVSCLLGVAEIYYDYQDQIISLNGKHISIQLVYDIVDEHGQYTVTIMNHFIPVKQFVYKLNEYEVMSYDMNFPAPTLFLDEVLSAIVSVC